MPAERPGLPKRAAKREASFSSSLCLLRAFRERDRLFPGDPFWTRVKDFRVRCPREGSLLRRRLPPRREGPPCPQTRKSRVFF